VSCFRTRLFSILWRPISFERLVLSFERFIFAMWSMDHWGCDGRTWGLISCSKWLLNVSNRIEYAYMTSVTREESLLPVSSGQTLLTAAVDRSIPWVADINGRMIDDFLTQCKPYVWPFSARRSTSNVTKPRTLID
jgi:hypothetical protein